jgi:chemotaxis protein MotB
MARRAKHAAHQNHERWMVSYADFVTLLFAFFVVMYATARIDESAPQRVSESVREALREDSFQSLVSTLLDEEKRNPGAYSADPAKRKKSTASKADAVLLEQFLPSMNFLSHELSDEIKKEQVQIRLTRRGLVISLRQAAFFPSGQDVIAPETYQAIGKVAQTIAKLPNHVRLEGHTDAIPIRNSQFRSNWHLSTARAISMLDLLTTEFKVPGNKFTVAGYAETIPVASNDTDDGRRKNRRVDIVVLNLYGINDEPVGGDRAQDELIHRLAEEKQAASSPR